MISHDEADMQLVGWSVLFQAFEDSEPLRFNTFTTQHEAETLVRDIKRVMWYLNIECHRVWSEATTL